MEKRIRKDLKMDISVIIPAYNCENTIVECLNSVIKQTYYSYICEVIIINDGSIDHTKQKIDNFIKNCGDNKIEVIDQKNSGVSVARNNGIKKAKGTWIAFLDSDDVWLENKIERQIKTILEHREICFLGTQDHQTLFCIIRKLKAYIMQIFLTYVISLSLSHHRYW